MIETRVRHVTIDCHNPYTQSVFWAEVLGYVEDPDNPNQPDDPEALIIDPTGRHPGLLFVPVPEPKSTKNRVHLDLVPEQSRDATVEAILAIGATLVADHRRSDGSGWAVLADPEGNEFCVERSAAERGIAAPVDTGDDQPYPDGIRTAGELEQLAGMLDWYRAAVLRKVSGIIAEHGAHVTGALGHDDRRAAQAPRPRRGQLVRRTLPRQPRG